MIQSWHIDLVKDKNLTRLSHRNTKGYVVTVVEAAILPEIMLWSSSEPFLRKLWFSRVRKRLITLLT